MEPITIEPGRLDSHDLVWRQMPLCRPESPEPAEYGAYLGNGTLGALVYAVEEPCDFPHHTVQVDVGRMDVADCGGTRVDGSEWWDKWGMRHKGTRLHTGGFRLLTRGLAQAGAMRLDLAQAECRAELMTKHGAETGTIAVRVLVAAEDPVVQVEVRHAGGERRPRFLRRAMPFPGWPAAQVQDRDGIRVEVQPLLDGQDYAVAWTEVVEPGRVLLLVSLGVSPRIKGFSRGGGDQRPAGDEAWDAVAKARRDLIGVETRHRAWWQGFHSRSQIAVPDARLEGFYAAMTYLLACTTRRGAPFPDLTGPWSYGMAGPDDWAHCPGYPHIWLNLNAQFHFLLHLASNHSDECGEVLFRSLAMLSDQLLGPHPDPDKAVGTGGGCGYDFNSGDREERLGSHLVWLLHNAWLTSRYAADPQSAQAWRRLLPLLAGALNEMLARVKRGADGKLHLHHCQSPEYPPTREFPSISVVGCTDSCYELSILRWGLARLLADLPQDPRAARWREVLSGLADYPQDESGLRIAREVPCDLGHRHYAHLMMAWPFREWSAENSAQRTLMQRSIKTWLTNPPDAKGRTGFTWAAAAALAAHCGDGEAAWAHLNTYFDEPRRGVCSGRLPNGMAREWGLCLETPLGAANALVDMLVQSHGGLIRVFPAVPQDWDTAQFLGLAAEGGFTVSARREGGRTVWVEVISQAGESVQLGHGIAGELDLQTAGGMQAQVEGAGLLLHGPVGARIRICRRGGTVQPAPIAERFHPGWRWGGAPA